MNEIHFQNLIDAMQKEDDFIVEQLSSTWDLLGFNATSVALAHQACLWIVEPESSKYSDETISCARILLEEVEDMMVRAAKEAALFRANLSFDQLALVVAVESKGAGYRRTELVLRYFDL
jgi:hypothetical protein